MLHVVGLLLGFADPPLRRESLILFSRHGIRVPFSPDPRGIGIFSTNPTANWYTNASDWGAPGEAYLTQHGESVVERMGEYYRDQLVSSGLLPSDGSRVTAYADADPTGRDVKTAQSFFRGLLPGVDVPIHANKSEVAAMFNQGAFPGGHNAACIGPSRLQVDGTIGGDARGLSVAHREAILRLSDAIRCCQPAVCKPSGAGSGNVVEAGESTATCDLMGMPTTWSDLFYLFYRGPLSTAASLTEYLQLMYLNNLSLAEVAPTLDEERLSALLSLHQLGLGFTEDVIATRAYGSDMLAVLLGTIEQLALGKSVPGLRSSPDDHLVYFAGHDINIYFLRTFLRLNWLTASWNANQAMPGGMLAFEILRDKASAAFVRASFVSQSYSQQRISAPLTGGAPPPDQVFVTIPECATGPQATCPLDDFRTLVLRAIRHECVSTVPVEDL